MSSTSYNLDYSVDLTKIYEKALAGAGIKIQDKISYAEGDIDFSAQVSKLKALKPEAVIMTGYYQESAQLMIEMRKQGINCPILGSNGFNDPKILDLAGKAMEGSVWASGFFPENPDPKVRKFVAKVQEKYKKKPNQFHAQAYDALWIIAEAIKKAGVTESTPENRVKIRDAMYTISNFPGVSGTHTFQTGKRGCREIGLHPHHQRRKIRPVRIGQKGKTEKIIPPFRPCQREVGGIYLSPKMSEFPDFVI